jgi:IS1 family transposase/transposase-like protein
MRHMIKETITYSCRSCGSINIVKNGTNKCGNQQYHCHDCGVYRVLKPAYEQAHPDQEKALRAYREGVSLRGVARIFKVGRQTFHKWLMAEIEQQPTVADTLMAAKEDDILEVDEAWSFVLTKQAKRWLWTALCRRTRQIVAFVIGDRSEDTCRQLWQAIPQSYRHCHSYSDFWEAYQAVFPAKTHQAVGKKSGQVAHMERWYNTLRQWLARFTRKTLAFSKRDKYHELITRWFIIHYNLSCC